ncbi:MAG: anthranilate phosphoribosyltransferase [Kordiimonadales bacterium]|nr:MAG: anthranilate phosphoribosyltransferase [Kordiimonadales bacterium]
MSELTAILSKLADGEILTEQEARASFDILMSGAADAAQMAGFLTALRVRGETTAEILGGAKAMRARAELIKAPETALDIVGTGGSGLDTYNVSTAVSFVASAAGIQVAKHGNRAASSKSGSADVLEELGGSLDLSFEQIEQALVETGFTFLFARAHHKAMRHVAQVRSSLKYKTIFNLLGPLSSPAQAKNQLLGVFDRRWLRPMADVLQQLGSNHVMVVHGSDGMDEITLSGPTYVAELKNDEISEYEISPGDFGLPTVPLDELLGGDTRHNANAINRVFDGEKFPFRDLVLFNAGASLMLGGKAGNIAQGIEQAVEIIDTGKAKAALAKWVAFTAAATNKAN